MRELVVYRVSYGKVNVPLEHREYQTFIGGPVGCAQELKEVFIDSGAYDKVICMDKNGFEVEQEVSK